MGHLVIYLLWHEDALMDQLLVTYGHWKKDEIMLKHMMRSSHMSFLMSVWS